MTKPSVRVVLFHLNVISDVVNLTKNLPCVDPSGRSRSTAASDTDAVRMHLGGIAHFFCVEVDSLTNSRPTSLSRLLVRLTLQCESVPGFIRSTMTYNPRMKTCHDSKCRDFHCGGRFAPVETSSSSEFHGAPLVLERISSCPPRISNLCFFSSCPPRTPYLFLR